MRLRGSLAPDDGGGAARAPRALGERAGGLAGGGGGASVPLELAGEDVPPIGTAPPSKNLKRDYISRTTYHSAACAVSQRDASAARVLYIT